MTRYAVKRNMTENHKARTFFIPSCKPYTRKLWRGTLKVPETCHDDSASYIRHGKRRLTIFYDYTTCSTHARNSIIPALMQLYLDTQWDFRIEQMRRVVFAAETPSTLHLHDNWTWQSVEKLQSLVQLAEEHMKMGCLGLTVAFSGIDKYFDSAPIFDTMPSIM